MTTFTLGLVAYSAILTAWLGLLTAAHLQQRLRHEKLDTVVDRLKKDVARRTRMRHTGMQPVTQPTVTTMQAMPPPSVSSPFFLEMPLSAEPSTNPIEQQPRGRHSR